MSSGTESTEVAIKLMRLNAQKNPNKKGIIAISGNWYEEQWERKCYLTINDSHPG